MPTIEKKNIIVEALERLFKKDPSYNLLLHNDDYVYEGIVREALMATFGYSAEHTMGLMLQAHNTGSAVIWSGQKDEAEKYALLLRTRYGLTCTVADN